MKKKIVIIIVILILTVFLGILFINFFNNQYYKISFEKTAQKYEEKYLSTKSEIDLINLVYFLDSSKVLDERRLKYTPALIEIISEDGITQSEMSDFYSKLNIDDPKTLPISLYIHDLLCFKQYDLFDDEFVKYYPHLSSNDRKFLSSVVVEAYKNLKNTTILETLVVSYSKVAKESEDEIIINECLSEISSLKYAVEYVNGETISIDNEILRSMTVDGEHIPLTLKGEVVKHYSVSTGDYVDKIDQG